MLALLESQPRHVLHVNPDDFFASLARQRDASLRGRPVVVGNLMNRGSVVSASYEARACGVHPGLTMQQAQRLAPDAALVQLDWAYARRATHELHRILEAFAPRIEPLGPDEAFVDYSGCAHLHGPPLDAAARLRRQIRDRVQLDVSIGIASNKLVSRFASTSAKKHSLLDVLPGYEASFLAPCPVSRLPGVGAPLARKLGDMGIATVGDLARIPAEVLRVVFGRQGVRWADATRGVDHTPVGRARPRLEIEAADTFEPDELDSAALEARLEGLCARVGRALRQRGLCARRLGVRLEHSDRVCAQRFVTLRPPTHLDPRLAIAAREVLAQAYTRRVRVRRLQVVTSGFEPSPVQLDLFEPDVEARWRRLMQAADRVQGRYPAPGVLVSARAFLGYPDAPPRTRAAAGNGGFLDTGSRGRV